MTVFKIHKLCQLLSSIIELLLTDHNNVVKQQLFSTGHHNCVHTKHRTCTHNFSRHDEYDQHNKCCLFISEPLQTHKLLVSCQPTFTLEQPHSFVHSSRCNPAIQFTLADSI